MPLSGHTTSDEKLLNELRAGRRRAFDRLYRDYHGSIYDLCARILGDREEAKDLTHDVFLKAIRQLPGEGSGLRLRPWLYRVATNTCFDALRRRRTRGDDPRAVELAASPVDEYQRSRDAVLIEQTLAGLNERYRTALVLRDLHGLEPLEIAEVLDVPRGTADVVVHRAREAFRRGFTTLAGTDAPAPANLGLVLAPMAVPAALQAAPLWPALAPHAVPLPGPEAAVVGPAGAGLLAKLGASLGVKIAATVAAVTVVVGGGLVTTKVADRDRTAEAHHAIAQDHSSAHDVHDSAKSSHEAHAALSAGHHARWEVHSDVESTDHAEGAHTNDAAHDGTTTHGGTSTAPGDMHDTGGSHTTPTDSETH